MGNAADLRDAGAGVPVQRVICNQPGCDRVMRARGMCKAHYENHRERMVAYGRWDTGRVSTEPVKAHIRMLNTAGMGGRVIAAQSGVSQYQVWAILNNRLATTSSELVEKILAVAPTDLHPSSLIDSTGSVRRLRALIASGYTRHELAAELDRPRPWMNHIIAGKRPKVMVHTRDRVAEMYARLQMVPGSSERSRKEAETKGWAVPFLWDDEQIDLPGGAPSTSDRTTYVRRSRVDVAETRDRIGTLLEAGYSYRTLSAEIGIGTTTIRAIITGETQAASADVAERVLNGYASAMAKLAA